jgi:hypothetical protein
MRVLILYHPKSDHGGMVEDYVTEYSRTRNKQIELLSLETKEGAEMAKLYDVTNYPALLIRQDDGHLLQMWQGNMLPLMNEVDGYRL